MLKTDGREGRERFTHMHVHMQYDTVLFLLEGHYYIST